MALKVVQFPDTITGSSTGGNPYQLHSVDTILQNWVTKNKNCQLLNVSFVSVDSSNYIVVITYFEQ